MKSSPKSVKILALIIQDPCREPGSTFPGSIAEFTATSRVRFRPKADVEIVPACCSLWTQTNRYQSRRGTSALVRRA
jgi:hypothetical protein